MVMKHVVGTVVEPRTKLSGRSGARVLRGWFVGKTGLIVVFGRTSAACLYEKECRGELFC